MQCGRRSHLVPARYSRPHRAATGVTDAEYAVLKDIARRTGQDVSGLVRRVLTNVIARWTSAESKPS
jgi:hypothetical protein